MSDLFIFVLIMLFLAFVPMYVALLQGASPAVVYAAALSGAVAGAILLFARRGVIAFLSRRKGALTTAALVLYVIVLVAATVSELLGLGWFRFLSF